MARDPHRNLRIKSSYKAIGGIGSRKKKKEKNKNRERYVPLPLETSGISNVWQFHAKAKNPVLELRLVI